MIKKTYKILSIMLIFTCTTLLSGCWDYADIEKRGLTTSVGVDKVQDNITLVNEIAGFKTSLSKNAGTSELGNIHRIFSYGINFEEARSNDDRKEPFPVFLGAVKTVVFGENYAKDGLFPYINRINKIYDYRKTILPVISRESPKEIFTLNISNDLSSGFLIEDIVRNLNENGKGVLITFGDILNLASLNQIGFIMPYIGIENGLITYLGFAIINEEGKFIDVIDMNKSKGIVYLLSSNPNLVEYASLKNTNNLISFTPINFKRKIKTEYNDDKVSININLTVKEKLDYSYVETTLNSNDITALENILSNKIKGYITNIINKAQEDYKCDIFKFLKYFRAQNPKAYKTIDWKDKFSKAQINVNVEVKITSQNLYDYKASNKK